jgi:hypothetical protein
MLGRSNTIWCLKFTEQQDGYIYGLSSIFLSKDPCITAFIKFKVKKNVFVAVWKRADCSQAPIGIDAPLQRHSLQFGTICSIEEASFEAEVFQYIDPDEVELVDLEILDDTKTKRQRVDYYLPTGRYL